MTGHDLPHFRPVSGPFRTFQALSGEKKHFQKNLQPFQEAKKQPKLNRFFTLKAGPCEPALKKFFSYFLNCPLFFELLHYKINNWERAVNTAIGIRLDLPGGQFDFVKEAGLKLQYYFNIIDRRASEYYDKEEEMLMYAIRAYIMEFNIIKDMSFKVIQELGVPVEMGPLLHFAPIIKY